MNKIFDKIKKKIKISFFGNFQPEIILLIGFPGSGKSTLIQNKIKSGEWADYIITSTDIFVEEEAKKRNSTYNEIFSKYYETAEKKFFKLLKHSFVENKNIVVDRTNVSKTVRSEILKLVPENYIKKAIVFHLSKEELLIRLKKRHEETGKFITLSILEKMINEYEHPTIDEFNEILKA